MTIINNRIRCAASTNGSGVIDTFAANSGFLAPTNLWANSGGMAVGTVGTHHYLLEDTTGGWELGTVVTTSTSASTRTVVQSNMNSGAGFANDVTGLTMSMVGDDMAALACHRTTLLENSPSAAGNGLAAGASSVAADAGTAVGYQAKALGFTSTSIGSNAGDTLAADYSTAVGAGSVAHGAYSTALGAYAYAFYPGEIVLGDRIRVIPLSGEHGATATVMEDWATGSAVAVTFADAAGHHGVTANVRVYDFDGVASDLAVNKIFKVSYDIFSDGTTLTVLGSPVITTVHTGASVGATTLTIDATTGVPKISYSGGGASHLGSSSATLTLTKSS